MHYEKEISELIITQIEALGFIQVKPANKPRKSVHAFLDPVTQSKYITYTSGYIQVEHPRSTRYTALGCTMSPINPTVSYVRATKWGNFKAQKQILLPLEVDRLMRLLHILKVRLKKREKRALKA